MRILAASVTNRDLSVLKPHLESLTSLRFPPKVEMHLAYISDGLGDEETELLLNAGARVAEALPKPPDATYEVREERHDWSLPTFGWLAREKQRLLDLAKEERFDGIFFVDSDLILGPETLESLIFSQKDVVSGVFWTKWTPDAPPLPQVWMRHPYEFDGKGVTSDEFLKSLGEKSLRPVGGLGACTLIRSNVFEKVQWFPLIDGLPTHGMWQGEDRHFCVGAARNHVELWADAWPDIYHIYRPSDLRSSYEFAAERVLRPEVGDWVSIVLEAVEEKELLGRREHIRGRFGALDVLVEIEEALSDMEVGDSKIVKVSFPVWWKVPTYRGKTKNLLLRLLDAKRYD